MPLIGTYFDKTQKALCTPQETELVFRIRHIIASAQVRLMDQVHRGIDKALLPCHKQWLVHFDPFRSGMDSLYPRLILGHLMDGTWFDRNVVLPCADTLNTMSDQEIEDMICKETYLFARSVSKKYRSLRFGEEFKKLISAVEQDGRAKWARGLEKRLQKQDSGFRVLWNGTTMTITQNTQTVLQLSGSRLPLEPCTQDNLGSWIDYVLDVSSKDSTGIFAPAHPDGRYIINGEGFRRAAEQAEQDVIEKLSHPRRIRIFSDSAEAEQSAYAALEKICKEILDSFSDSRIECGLDGYFDQNNRFRMAKCYMTPDVFQFETECVSGEVRLTQGAAAVNFHDETLQDRSMRIRDKQWREAAAFASACMDYLSQQYEVSCLNGSLVDRNGSAAMRFVRRKDGLDCSAAIELGDCLTDLERWKYNLLCFLRYHRMIPVSVIDRYLSGEKNIWSSEPSTCCA